MSYLQTLRIPVCLCVLAATIVAVSYAQETSTATLVGTVTDPTKSVVPGAKIKLVNVDTQFVSETTTSAEGAYLVQYLPPGNYRLTVEAAGFKTYAQEGIYIRAVETPRIDVQLAVGAQTESVTVTAGAPLLETDTAASGTTYQGETIQRIPVPDQRTLRDLYFYPNTIGDQIMGQRQADLAYTIDGVSAKSPGTAMVDETTNAVQSVGEDYEEIKVYMTGMPAEIGHASGGMMAMVMRSGSNQLHGTGEVRIQTQEMIDRAYLQQTKATVPYYYGEYTATLNGPVIIPKLYNGTNKTFFLAGYELFDEHYNTGITTTVPSAAMLGGNFAFPENPAGGLLIYDPMSTTQLGNGTWTRTPFVGNMVPLNRFNPVVVNFLSHNPWAPANAPGVPSATGPSNNLITSTNRSKLSHRHRADFKLDHQFTPNHRASVRLTPVLNRTMHNNPNPALTFDGNGSVIDSAQQPFPSDFWNLVASDVYLVSPTMTNEFRFGFNHRTETWSNLSTNQGWGAKLGMPNVNPNAFPYFNIGYGLSTLPEQFYKGADYTFQDNVTKLVGSHTLKAGYELIRTTYNSSPAAYPSGQYSFGGTELPFTPNTGQTFASFLLGTVSSATFTEDFANWQPEWWSHQWYVQDDWKPFRGLTVNYGLRWSYETPFQTKYGQQSEFNPTAVDPLTGLTGAIVHQPGALSKKQLNNWGPRIGVAWNFAPKFVFRSSFTIIDSDVFCNNSQNILFQEYQGTANIQMPSGNPNYAFTLSQGPPAINYSELANHTSPYIGTNYSGRSAAEWDPNMRMPYVMTWSGGLQYEVKRNYLIEVQYMGQGGVGLINSLNRNQIPLSIYNTASVTTLNTIYANQQNYLPYTQFGSISYYSNFSHNTYHSGNLRFERRYSSGLAYSAYYTWQKTMTEQGLVDYYNQSLSKGPSGPRHRFIGLVQYNLPFGKGRRWLNSGLKSVLLGGWNVTWSQTFQSGGPFSVSYSGSPYKELPGGGSRMANVLVSPYTTAETPGWKGVGPNRFPTSAQIPYLVASDFAYPAAYALGTEGPNQFTGPGLDWSVTSLAKWFQWGEKTRLEVGLDGTNQPFKHPNYNGPNSTWNSGSNAAFGDIGGYSNFNNVGSSQANWNLRAKFEF